MVRLARAATRLGTIRATGANGRNTLTIGPRLRGRRLRPGRYLLVVRATDAAGNRSGTTRLRFRALRSAR